MNQFQFLRSTIGRHHWQQVWEATHTTASFNQSPSTRASTQKCQVKQLRTLNCQTGINLVHRPHVAFIVHTICTVWCCVWPALWQCTLCTDWRSLGMPTRNIKRGNQLYSWKCLKKWSQLVLQGRRKQSADCQAQLDDGGEAANNSRTKWATKFWT